MPIYMWLLLIFLVFQRLAELVVARRNENWMKSRGGKERGAEHYKLFVIVHAMFFVSILVEVIVRDVSNLELSYTLFFFFLVTQILRIWCIQSLGRFWNTKIIVSPRFTPVTKGIYKYIQHPNYVVVGIELFVIPLLFGAIFTAILFPILHILLLTIRIPAEEKALNEMNPE
ncbi:isoprenylcysteine carboxyl methyltransferase family protein [Virgibacillus sediminis]|uniref:Isoprenylcysteine carboxyl methyltransferase family protein n=1 Tax=Virgibacillus sediminis TaxID=202260 RepID=A0ABV7A610_9BACI